MSDLQIVGKKRIVVDRSPNAETVATHYLHQVRADCACADDGHLTIIGREPRGPRSNDDQKLAWTPTTLIATPSS